MTGTGENQAGDLLARARRGLSPTAADAERVRRSLDAALSAGAAESPGGPTSARVGAAPGSTARPPWIPRLLVHTLVAALAGTSGYWLGRGSAVRELRTSTVQPSSSSSSSGPPLPTPSTLSPPPSSPLPSASASAPGPAHPHIHRPVAAPIEGPAATSAAESLAEEVRALRSVERALRDGQPGLALALLARLDREVPDGKLVEEREATAAIARCASGERPIGVDLTETFADLHPDSVYLGRVRQACGRP